MAKTKITEFEKWWDSDGKYFDPDTEDVPWYDKRAELAEYAWHRGRAKLSCELEELRARDSQRDSILLRELLAHIQLMNEHGRLRVSQTRDSVELNAFNQGRVDAAESMQVFYADLVKQNPPAELRARQNGSVEVWMEAAARELRVKIHSMNGDVPENSPNNAANKRWLDSVCDEDAKIIAKHFNRAAPGADAEREPEPYMHEDELPANMPKKDYAKWYEASWLPEGGGCRVGPIYPPEVRERK
jgi:hypothetical protein